MAKYRVWMKVVGTACVEVDADSEGQAKEVANDLYADAPCSICHQCGDEISEPTMTEAVDAAAID